MFRTHGALICYAPDAGTGSGGGGPAPFAQSLPEPLRAHEAFKDVKDVGDLATRYVGAVTPKPFAEILPKEIASEAYFKDIKDVPSLATKAFHQAKLIGRNPDTMVIIPEKDDAAGWDQVYARLGRPAKPEEYALQPPQGQQWSEQDKAFHAVVFPAAHKLGLNNAQLAGLAEVVNGYGAKVRKDLTDADLALAAKTQETLKTEWGQAYDQKLDGALGKLKEIATAAKVDFNELNAELARDKLGNRPAIARLFSYLADQDREDGGLAGRNTERAGAVSAPAEAQQQINGLMADPAFLAAWKDKTHPGHADAVAKRAKLFELAYPPAA